MLELLLRGAERLRRARTWANNLATNPEVDHLAEIRETNQKIKDIRNANRLKDAEFRLIMERKYQEAEALDDQIASITRDVH